MSSIFKKIIDGEIPCHRVAENDSYLAFLDVNPVAKGHTLVIPKKEIDYIFDIEDKELAEFHVFAKKVARAVKSAIPCKKIGMAVVGLEVPHAHIHLIPMNHIGDLSFTGERLSFTNEEYIDIANAIKNYFDNSIN
jgi:histidine triad (HIT) family protein